MHNTPPRMSYAHPKYPKIQSIFKRDPSTKHRTFLEGDFSTPEFELLKDIEWQWTEKLDGANIRIGLRPHDVAWGNMVYSIGGRTDEAQIPRQLHDWIESHITSDMLVDTFGEDSIVTLYGEGVGAKIQKNGHFYGPEQHFVLFDAMVNGVWLERESIIDVAEDLRIHTAPIMLRCSLPEIVDFVKHRPGYESSYVARLFKGFAPIEGFVGRPNPLLLDRRGNPIITKIKMKDYHG